MTHNNYWWKRVEDNEQDRAIVQAWLDKDEFHKQAGITVDMLFAPGTESYFAMDGEQHVLVIRKWRAWRVAAQFNPDTPYKSAKMGDWLVGEFKREADLNGCTEVLVLPGGKAVRYSENLGFENRPTMGLNVELSNPGDAVHVLDSNASTNSLVVRESLSLPQTTNTQPTPETPKYKVTGRTPKRRIILEASIAVINHPDSRPSDLLHALDMLALLEGLGTRYSSIRPVGHPVKIDKDKDKLKDASRTKLDLIVNPKT